MQLDRIPHFFDKYCLPLGHNSFKRADNLFLRHSLIRGLEFIINVAAKHFIFQKKNQTSQHNETIEEKQPNCGNNSNQLGLACPLAFLEQ
jgi:hypothetical protein